MKNYYDILCVSKSASSQEIGKAYGRLMVKLQPEAKKDAFFAEYFKQIKQAYSILSDVETRDEYDNKLEKLFLGKEIETQVVELKSQLEIETMKTSALEKENQQLKKRQKVPQKNEGEELEGLRKGFKAIKEKNRNLRNIIESTERDLSKLKEHKKSADAANVLLEKKITVLQDKNKKKPTDFWKIGFILSSFFVLIMFFWMNDNGGKTTHEVNDLQFKINELQKDQEKLKKDLESERGSKDYYKSSNEKLKKKIVALENSKREIHTEKESKKESKSSTQSNGSYYTSNNKKNNSSYTSNDKSYTGDYMYKTNLSKRSTSFSPLRSRPNINATKLYSVPKEANIYVLKPANSSYVLVFVDGYKGYISNKLLAKPLPNEQMNSTTAYKSSSKSKYPESYLYRTKLKDPIGVGVSIRQTSNINSKVLEKKRKGDYVYVLQKTESVFYKVWVDGYVGYISGKYLK
ncbi:DnaJ domain-containing protein [Marinifilum fragile]|uniref:DnaJ domain-containing protein n=1 Tax=Marinifilum fragile TaxID=570161 RepID=UPI002AA8E4AD|nr:DnaJ domain-containing protein [Marinifilum fragile]